MILAFSNIKKLKKNLKSTHSTDDPRGSEKVKVPFSSGKFYRKIVPLPCNNTFGRPLTHSKFGMVHTESGGNGSGDNINFRFKTLMLSPDLLFAVRIYNFNNKKN